MSKRAKCFHQVNEASVRRIPFLRVAMHIEDMIFCAFFRLKSRFESCAVYSRYQHGQAVLGFRSMKQNSFPQQLETDFVNNLVDLCSVYIGFPSNLSFKQKEHCYLTNGVAGPALPWL